ncbi:MAG TPA: AAA family ATPase, partial [Gaiellaceae bacterium]|nr:AAA family ATPase [Gaiellaceae bacterium]
REEVEARRDAAGLAVRGARSRLEGLLADRARAEDELSDSAGRRESAVSALYRLRSGAERLGVRAESASGLRDRLAAELAALPEGSSRDRGPSLHELGRAADEAAAAARGAARTRDDLAERARSTSERLAVLDRSIAEREGITPAARALAEGGLRLALDAVRVDPGAERAVAAALGWRASAVLAADAEAGLTLARRARDEGLGSLVVLAARDPGELVQELPVVPLDELLSVRIPSVTREGFGYDPARGELWFSGEAAEAVLLELEARRRGLAAEAAELGRRLVGAERHATETAAAAAESEEAFRSAAPAPGLVPRPRVEAGVLTRLAGLADELVSGLAAARGAADRFEPPLRARVDAGSVRAKELGEELRQLGAAEVGLRKELDEASARATEAEVELARLDAEAAEARRRLDVLGAVEPADGDDREELGARVERLEARRISLGQVNPLAREEYEAEKERLDDLRVQREDLERSLDELEKLRAELAETVERRFAETFASVAGHFEDVASTLFPGGEGRLRLVEAEDEDGESGIEVELRPAGKRITRLSLLSGGEKALGAISFLFALFLARPCAFYLLDEVEAALDDTNIARFVELLRRYADRAQFVVVTHQKRTMEAADVLYGVTMGSDGVSQVVSRRLPRHEHAAA